VFSVCPTHDAAEGEQAKMSGETLDAAAARIQAGVRWILVCDQTMRPTLGVVPRGHLTRKHLREEVGEELVRRRSHASMAKAPPERKQSAPQLRPAATRSDAAAVRIQAGVR